MHHFLDNLQDIFNDERLDQFELFEHLYSRFPKALVYIEAPNKLSPFATAIQMDFPGSHKSFMISHIPRSTRHLDFGEYCPYEEDDFDYNEEECVGFDTTSDAMASGLNRMTDLQSLRLKICYQDEKLIDPVCNLITAGKLEFLVVSATPQNADEDPPSSLFSPIFDSIKGSALLEFGLLGLQDSNLACSYQDLILEILKSNFTLRQTHISALPAYEDCSNRSKKQRDIDYYTTLNRYGRSLVRHPETHWIEIFDNLAQAAQRSEPEHPTWTSAVPVLYGLLREAPGKWSVSAGVEQVARPRGNPRLSLKRKASHSLDRRSLG
ncbi:hypothetical protein SEMRO_1955_G307720.1 [Seminavis robusta]|uniref:Uncharacterized protein n=1 Tax=Seminavis robusta TaxID=568900 RepID=A0A9N8ES93_9STRA|nr:hypothetical protein SEMRO_1955_G307720.1 [Seminavis robusta]|eukprot:Sro1955_g307720.1 n/a (323) ;mRNA; f:15939-16907